MSLFTQAEVLADLSDLAGWCAECFCRARCAGADVTAISPAARGALALGASWTQLAAQTAPHEADTAYLQEAEEIRIAIREQVNQLREALREAEEQEKAAAQEMRRARHDRDWDRYWQARRWWQEARHAVSVCEETLSRLEKADRCLAWVPARYHQAYEGAVTFAGQGGQLPHEGRWITGENPSLTLIGGSPPTKSEALRL